MARRDTVDAVAYQRYLKGRYQWNQRTRNGYRKAIEFFREAIALDRAYARAYAGLADAQAVLTFDGEPVWERYARALGAARKALEIDDTLGEAHTSVAMLTQNKDWDLASAERHTGARRVEPELCHCAPLVRRVAGADGQVRRRVQQYGLIRGAAATRRPSGRADEQRGAVTEVRAAWMVGFGASALRKVSWSSEEVGSINRRRRGARRRCRAAHRRDERRAARHRCTATTHGGAAWSDLYQPDHGV